MLDKPPGDDLGHDLVRVVDALAAVKAQCEGERAGQVGRVGGRELVGVEHRWTIAGNRERGKNMRGAILMVAMLLAAPALGQSPDISTRRLLDGWKAADQSTHLLAEVIASAFASGLSWSAAHRGKPVFCPPPDLKGAQAMSALEQFLKDHPDAAGKPYGDALAASLSQAFPCPIQ